MDAERAAVEAAALDLVRSNGAELLGLANYYAGDPDDAEDAYQRALEILLTKAPSANPSHLLPWMKTVLKHEAFAVHRARSRDVPAAGEELESIAGPVVDFADDRAEASDRLRLGAEALQRLKPQETQALLMRASGLSYAEICSQTGWTYTKVNRCLAEGRASFFQRVAGIESGEECERMAPLLSALADGEASAEDMLALRPHLRSCSGCRAMLRDYREAPQQVAAVFGPLAAIGAGGAGGLGAASDSVGHGVGAVGAWLSERAGMAVLRFQAGIEAVAGSKVAVVAASTVALAGGGAAAVEEVGSHAPPSKPAVMAAAKPKPVSRAHAREAKPAALRIATSYATSVRQSSERVERAKATARAATPPHGAKRERGDTAASTGAATAPAATSGPAREFSPSPDPPAPSASPPAATEPEPTPEPRTEDDAGGEFGP